MCGRRWRIDAAGSLIHPSVTPASRRGHGRHVPYDNVPLVEKPHPDSPRLLQCMTLQRHSAHSYTSAYRLDRLFAKHGFPQAGQAVSEFNAWYFMSAQATTSTASRRLPFVPDMAPTQHASAPIISLQIAQSVSGKASLNPLNDVPRPAARGSSPRPPVCGWDAWGAEGGAQGRFIPLAAAPCAFRV